MPKRMFNSFASLQIRRDINTNTSSANFYVHIINRIRNVSGKHTRSNMFQSLHFPTIEQAFALFPFQYCYNPGKLLIEFKCFEKQRNGYMEYRLTINVSSICATFALELMLMLASIAFIQSGNFNQSNCYRKYLTISICHWIMHKICRDQREPCSGVGCKCLQLIRRCAVMMAILLSSFQLFGAIVWECFQSIDRFRFWQR